MFRLVSLLTLLQDNALAFACSQLNHRFPRVRRYAAEHLYVCLLEHPDLLIDNGGDFALERMLDFPWDGENTSAQQCREIAQEVADEVGVSLPATSAVASATPRKHVARDDFATYSALVDSIS